MGTVNTIGKIVLLNAGGWMIHIESVLPLVRMFSLVIPVVISILVYRDNKRRKDKAQNEKK